MEKPPAVVLADIVHLLQSRRDASVAELLPIIEQHMEDNKMSPKMFFIPVLIFGSGVPQAQWMDFNALVKFERDGTTMTANPTLVIRKHNEEELKTAKRYFFNNTNKTLN